LRFDDLFGGQAYPGSYFLMKNMYKTSRQRHQHSLRPLRASAGFFSRYFLCG
jgi:hypothetical protein